MRNKIAKKIRDKFNGIEGFRVMEPIKSSYAVYYKLIIFYDYNFSQNFRFFYKKDEFN